MGTVLQKNIPIEINSRTTLANQIYLHFTDIVKFDTVLQGTIIS